jgi:hypothetical protein
MIGITVFVVYEKEIKLYSNIILYLSVKIVRAILWCQLQATAAFSLK